MVSNRKYKINYYSAKKLYDNGIKKDGYLICNNEVSSYALIGTYEREDCHLFSQAIKALGDDVNLSHLFIIIDFTDLAHEQKVSEFLPFKNGIKINIDGQNIVFTDYLKSNSMNKNHCIYYIDSEYFKTVHERIGFGFDRVDRVPMSKWYAYSGLSLSDAVILDNLIISRDEVCVIPDKITRASIECITAISIPVLLDKLHEYKVKIETYLHSRAYYKMLDESYEISSPTLGECDLSTYISELDMEINCYYTSKDFPKLPLEIQDLITEIIELKSVSMDKIIDYIDDMIYDYEQGLERNVIKWYKIHVTNFPIDINNFDGEGLISLEFAEQINKELFGKAINTDEFDEEEELNEDYVTSFQIRLPFIKGVVHSCDIKAFCQKHNISKIKGIYSYNNNNIVYKNYDVNKLKLVLTESQFKAASFMKGLKMDIDQYFDLIEKYDYHIGISGVEPKPKTQVKLCYQFLSTMPIKPNEIDYLIDENMALLSEKSSVKNVISNLFISDNEYYKTAPYLYKINPEFYQCTNLFASTRRKLFDNEKKNLALGRLNICGCRKYLSSDLLGLLYHMIGKTIRTVDSLKFDEFYSPNSNLSSRCILMRNPHYSRNEIVIMDNNVSQNKEREEFFKHLTGVLMVNPQSLTADRLGGADYDGDAVCIIDDQRLLNIIDSRIISSNGKYLYSLVKIPSIANQPRKNDTPYHLRIRSLESTFSNKTGFISNLAFERSLVAYHDSNTDLELLEEVAFFTVLGGLEIDSCKNGKKPALPKRNKKSADYLVVKDSFFNKHDVIISRTDLKQNITNINSNSGENTLYYVFSLFMKEKLSNLDISYEFYRPDYVGLEGLTSVISIVECYHILKNALHHFYEEGSLESTEIKKVIKKELNSIVKENGYSIDMENLINKFSTNAFDNFTKYLDNSIIPFHFLTDINDRTKFITEYLDVKKLAKNELEFLCDFKSSGYKGLYLILYYNYLNDNSTLLISKIQNIDLEQLKYIDEAVLNETVNIDKVYKLLTLHIDNICKLISGEVARHKIMKIINDYFRKCAKNLSYQDVFYVIDPLKSEMIFSIFDKQVKEFLNCEVNCYE